MQRHTDAVVPTAHGSHGRHTNFQAKTVKKSASHAAFSHSSELQDVDKESPSCLSLVPATSMPAEDASAMGSVCDATDVHCGTVQDLVESADVSIRVPIDKSSVCCCVPDRLVAIHVRSELTESHFDM